MGILLRVLRLPESRRMSSEGENSGPVPFLQSEMEKTGPYQGTKPRKESKVQLASMKWLSSYKPSSLGSLRPTWWKESTDPCSLTSDFSVKHAHTTPISKT